VEQLKLNALNVRDVLCAADARDVLRRPPYHAVGRQTRILPD